MADARAPETELVVNGVALRVAASPDASLLGVLRDRLGLMGTRVGCTEGYCGACTAHVDGRATQTCRTPLWSVAGRSVTTIEGAAPGSSIERVRAAFLAEQAAQCGYCVDGLVMTVAALLEDPATRSREAILHALDERHLCRCGAHVRILRAVERALAASGEAP